MSGDPLGETIGPYRILRPIGKGGMGEVLLAYDPRLDRKVAIKRLHAGDHPEVRRRFHREVRLTAALSHPAIVPVFDVVVDGEHENLVMELVEGPSLTRWLEEDRPLVAKLRVAEQVAAGLAYAHRHGIVHRDLKTENVLLTAEGQPKIGDFGIARRDVGSLPKEIATEGGDVHTQTGALLGTVRSMSPEQARGEVADARSDLFSFGVLLFEMVTGTSPFRAQSPLETLLRLASRPHPPVEVLVPDVPPALAQLIDELLEKDPDLRPRSADELQARLESLRLTLEDRDSATVTPAPAGPLAKAPHAFRRRRWLALLLLPAMGAALWLWLGRPRGPLYVAVLPPRLESTHPEDEAARRQLVLNVRGDIQQALASLAGLSPLSLLEIDQAVAAGPANDPRRLAAALGADELIASSISCLGGDCRLDLERRRPRDGRVVTPDPVELPAQEPGLASKAVRVAVRARLFPDLRPRRGDDRLAAVEDADYVSLVRIRQEVTQRPASDRLDGWLGELEAIRRRNPSFLEASLLEVEIAWRRYSGTHDATYAERARRVMEEAMAQAPERPEVFLAAAWLATVDGRPAEAEGFLARVEQIAPGDLRALDARAQLLEAQGRPDAALELRHKAIDRRPSWNRSYQLALLLFRLGRWDESRRALEGLLEEAPDHRPILALQARMELTAGDPRRAAELFEALLARSESFSDRGNLATAYLLLRDGASAARECEKLLALAPNHPHYLLELADARLLEGRRPEAEQLYRQVTVALAGSEAWTDQALRAQAHAQLGEVDAALALIDQAKRLAPKDDGQLALMAALVYTVVKERASAKLHMTMAAERGWGAWLRLAPFDVWTSDPEIGPWLEMARQGLAPKVP